MLNTIILLTGPVEEAALAAVLRNYNSRLAIHVAKSLADLEAIDSNVLRNARLIAFITPVVVPARILDSLGFGAYNFHLGRRTTRAGFLHISRSMSERKRSARRSMS
jgi:methionyl-tRNA formyltransferase